MWGPANEVGLNRLLLEVDPQGKMLSLLQIIDLELMVAAGRDGFVRQKSAVGGPMEIARVTLIDQCYLLNGFCVKPVEAHQRVMANRCEGDRLIWSRSKGILHRWQMSLINAALAWYMTSVHWGIGFPFMLNADRNNRSGSPRI